MNLIRTEFPDYDVLTLPAIPTHWKDTSWHNDACPSFETKGLRIFVDYADASQRENESLVRFAVLRDDVIVLDTDDWDAVLELVELMPAQQDLIAERFATILQNWLTPQEFAEMTRRARRHGR